MRPKARKFCPNCRRLQAKLDAQEARLKALEASVARLQQQLAAARKDSSTSSKPPFSDIVKPPKPAPPEGQERRRIGGQPGHPKHEHADFPPELINGGSLDYRLDLRPRCGHDLQPMLTIVARVIQQVDIKDVPLVIQEHRGHPGWCSCCQKVYEATGTGSNGRPAWRPGGRSSNRSGARQSPGASSPGRYVDHPKHNCR